MIRISDNRTEEAVSFELLEAMGKCMRYPFFALGLTGFLGSFSRKGEFAIV